MLELRSVSKQLGDFKLSGLNLQVEQGEYFVLLGPSGVGKTVLVELIAGVLQPDAGSILWQGKDIASAPPEERGFSLVYQDYALFPHLSVADNIAFGLKARRKKPAEIQQRVNALARQIGIDRLLDREPMTLSGGEQQRVALARALAIEPSLVLLDEPLAALDGRTRRRLRKTLKQIHQQSRAIIMHVTHDTEEAMSLGDRIGVMLHDRIHQVATPDELFRAPSDRDVADFLGLQNVLPLDNVQGKTFVSGDVRFEVPTLDESSRYVWIKPEEILLSRETFDPRECNQILCRVEGWEPNGSLLAVRLSHGDLQLWALVTHNSFRELRIDTGVELQATFKNSAVHCF